LWEEIEGKGRDRPKVNQKDLLSADAPMMRKKHSTEDGEAINISDNNFVVVGKKALDL